MSLNKHISTNYFNYKEKPIPNILNLQQSHIYILYKIKKILLKILIMKILHIKSD